MPKIRTTLLATALAAAGFAAHAASTDTEAVEFYNTSTGHYFVTSTASEALGVDAGAAGPGWVRTGRSFQVWSTATNAPGDAHPVCRFYSTLANSHFYTASASECAALQAMEAQDRAANGGQTKGWAYEGTAFFVQAPTGGQCPAGTLPVTRLYNHGFESGEGSNHRFVDDPALQQLMADRGWSAEGPAFCVQPKTTTGTEANLPPTTSGFDNLVGTWTGSGHFSTETSGSQAPGTTSGSTSENENETESTHDLSITIASDGTLSGTGDGCTFTGKVALGDGFRSFFEGTASASGCTDAAFNGDYSRVMLERFGASTLMVHLQRKDATTEATIEARLTNATTTGSNTNPTTPTTPPATTIAGDWSGTVAWVATQVLTAGHVVTHVESNKPLSLSISPTFDVTGSGFGCTVTGTLAAGPKDASEDSGSHDTSGSTGASTGSSGSSDSGDSPDRAGFPVYTGSLTLSGCDQALFNGTFANAHVVRAGTSRIVVNLHNQTQDAQGMTSLEIEGTLQAATSTSP